MSVINQMLRDLEERKSKNSGSKHYQDEVNIVAPKQPRLWWVLLPLLIVIIIAINLYLHFQNQKSSVATQEVEQLQKDYDSQMIRDLPVTISELENSVKNEIVNVPPEKKSAVKKEEKTITKAVVVPEPVKKETPKPELPQPSVTVKTIIKEEEVKKEPEKKMVVTKLDDQVKEAPSVIKKDKQEEAEKLVIKTPVKKDNKNKPQTEKQLLSSMAIVHEARVLMANDQSAAIKKLEDNLNNTVPGTDYYALLANLYQRQKRFDDAIVYYKKALAIAPDKGDLLIGIALAYQGTGEIKNAQEAFRRAHNSVDISPSLKQYALQQLRKISQ